jgi:hypothetical protein
MSTYALFLASRSEKETKQANHRAQYEEFLNTVKHHMKNTEAVEKLSQNCWQISLKMNMPFFCSLLRLADQYEILYRIAFFDKEVEWCS